jgi:hypothetical protein
VILRTTKTHRRKKLSKCKSVWLLSRSLYDTSIYEAGGNIALNCSSNISKVALFLDIEKAFYTTWHSGPLYKLSELEFSTSLIKLIASFLSDRKF